MSGGTGSAPDVARCQCCGVFRNYHSNTIKIVSLNLYGEEVLETEYPICDRCAGLTRKKLKERS